MRDSLKPDGLFRGWKSVRFAGAATAGLATIAAMNLPRLAEASVN